jgi:CrcB protein
MLDWRSIAAIGVGGGIGSILRYLVTLGMTQQFGPGYPWATFTINVTGSFIIGLVFELAQTRMGFSPVLRLFLMTGILGGYTTFSTYALDIVTLFSDRAPGLGVLYAAGSVVLGFLAAFAGIVLVRAFSMQP